MTPRRMFPFSLSGNPMEPDQFGYIAPGTGAGFNPQGITDIQFRCPLNLKMQCNIPLTTGPAKDDPTDRRWHWDGNLQAPTLSPSINCTGHERRCGWHGMIEAGCWKPDPRLGNP